MLAPVVQGDADDCNIIKTSQSVSVERWQAGLHGFHRHWDLLNVPWRLKGGAICCFAYFLLSWLLIDLAFVVEICVGLTQSCHVTEDFTSASLWPVTSRAIRRPTAWLCQWILASTLGYTTCASCATYWTVILFVTSLYTRYFDLVSCSYCDLFLSNVKWAAGAAHF